MNAHMRLIKSIDQYKTENKNAQMILQAARIALEMNPVGAESDSNYIVMMIRMGLLPVHVMFDDELLRQPPYPVTMLKKVAQFYS